MVIVVLNVGANTDPEWGGFRLPIYGDGTFKFVPIPLKDHFVVKAPAIAPTYRSLGLEGTVPSDKLDKRALLSPDFKNLAYGHLKRPSDGNIFNQLKEDGGFLFFYATLRHIPTGERIPAINPEWGAYLVGYFLIEFVIDEYELMEQSEIYSERLNDYAWYRTVTTDGKEAGADWWITGSSGGLFKKAIPLSNETSPKKWNAFTLKTMRTTSGKVLPEKAFCNWTLKVAKDEEDSFWQEIEKHNPSFSCERRFI